MGRGFSPGRGSAGPQPRRDSGSRDLGRSLRRTAGHLGTTVTLNDTSYTVVGVLPRDFEFVGQAADFQARNPVRRLGAAGAQSAKPSRGTHPLRVFARLRPGTSTWSRRRPRWTSIGANLARAYPEENKGKGIRAVPLRQQVTADVRRALLTLLGAVGFVLASPAPTSRTSCSAGRGAAEGDGASSRDRRQPRPDRPAAPHREHVAGLLGGVDWAGSRAGDGRAWRLSLPAGRSVAGRRRRHRLARPALHRRDLARDGVLFGLAPLFQARRVNASESPQHGTRVAGGLPTRLRNSLVIGPDGGGDHPAGRRRAHGQELVGTAAGPARLSSDQILTARVTLPSVRYPDAARVGGISTRAARATAKQSRRSVCRGDGLSAAQRRRQRMGLLIEGRPPHPSASTTSRPTGRSATGTSRPSACR